MPLNSHHHSVGKEKVSGLRLAPGSSFDHSSNDNETSFHSSPTSSHQRPAINANAKSDGANVKQFSETAASSNCKIRLADGSASAPEHLVGDLEDCLPSRQGAIPFLLTKGATAEASEYLSDDGAQPGAFHSGDSSASSNPEIESYNERLVSAVKVSPGEDDVIEEVARAAQLEAEVLRRQVRHMQQERQHIPVATAAATEQVVKEKTWISRNWKSMAVVGLTVVGATTIALLMQKDDPVVPIIHDTVAPTPSPTQFPCLEVMDTNRSSNQTTNGTTTPLLQLCQGDCNQDDDCAPGLICFHRSVAYAPVPGCSCWENDMTRHDYCIEPPEAPCLVKTNDFPLGLCEGNCQRNEDCQAGFYCRSWYEDFDATDFSDESGCELCEGSNVNLTDKAITLSIDSFFCFERPARESSSARIFNTLNSGIMLVSLYIAFF